MLYFLSQNAFYFKIRRSRIVTYTPKPPFTHTDRYAYSQTDAVIYTTPKIYMWGNVHKGPKW